MALVTPGFPWLGELKREDSAKYRWHLLVAAQSWGDLRGKLLCLAGGFIYPLSAAAMAAGIHCHHSLASSNVN